MYKAGTRLFSIPTTVEVIVTRAPSTDLVVSCCGVPLADTPGVRPTPVGEPDVKVGKRYEGPHGIELLCVVAGEGPLEVDGEPMTMRVAKTLPSSD